MRRIQTHRACLLALLALPLQPVIAQETTQLASPAATQTTEWAIVPPVAPAGSTLPEGMVLEEALVLPPGTILPGGAMIPVAPEEAAILDTAPAPTPMPVPTQTPTPSSVDVSTSVAPPPSPKRLPGQSSQGVPHVSGGIGDSEREEMQQVKSQYNLHTLFAVAGSGAYLSNIRVRIQDASGTELLATVTIGPWFFAKLAPGDYDVTAEHAGQSQTQRISIPASGAVSAPFYWPAP